MEFLFGVSDYLLYICKLFDYKETLKVYTVNVKKIMKKLIFIGLLIALFFTACKKEKYYEGYHTHCNVLMNHSGHDLKITLVREDTTVYYHLADNDSAILNNGKNYLFDDAPSMNHDRYDDWPTWYPNSKVERIAICTFDDTCSHVSRKIYYYDSIGEFERAIYTPEYCNFFSRLKPFFDHHNYIQNDTIFHQFIITPAYYDHAASNEEVYPRNERTVQFEL